MNIKWNQLGGQTGIGLIVVGFILVFLGWNGAASVDRVPSQFPYLISGGVSGLCFVIAGAAMLVVQNQREDRARIEARLGELNKALETLAAVSSSSNGATGDDVVAGPTSYHRPDCRLLAGRSGLPRMSVSGALGSGLSACRTCEPPGDDGEATVQMRAVDIDSA